MKNHTTSFVLSGFSHDLGFRIFEFDCLENGKVRTRHTVRADLMLVRKHGIHVQELPLLCRKVLDDCQEWDRSGSMTLSEAEMMACAEREAARSRSSKRRPPRRPESSETPEQIEPAR
ncbi:MAG TPA: hypothetical protein VKX39_13675 [Bryobacteraceae bacterium]|nr:hypothetical protein [Bryobacteraceae bacterium]